MFQKGEDLSFKNELKSKPIRLQKMKKVNAKVYILRVFRRISNQHTNLSCNDFPVNQVHQTWRK
jgi:hypothetical protein